MVQNMSPHIVCTTKRRRAALNRTGKPLTGLDLLASQLVRTQASIRAKDLATPGNRAVETDAGIAFGVDLQMVLETLGGGQYLVTLGPGARVLDAHQTTGMLETMAHQVVARGVGGITARLGAVVELGSLLLLAQLDMGSTALLGSKSDHTAWDRAGESLARIVLAVFLDVDIERLAVGMDLATVVD